MLMSNNRLEGLLGADKEDRSGEAKVSQDLKDSMINSDRDRAVLEEVEILSETYLKNSRKCSEVQEAKEVHPGDLNNRPKDKT
jgi:hypothetical protein